jgi:hypothetical protein
MEAYTPQGSIAPISPYRAISVFSSLLRFNWQGTGPFLSKIGRSYVSSSGASA